MHKFTTFEGKMDNFVEQKKTMGGRLERQCAKGSYFNLLILWRVWH